MNEFAIEAEKLVVHYGKVKALNGIDLKVKRGETFGFIGPNGAGKSTFIKTALGLIRPTSGKVFLDSTSPLLRAPRKVLGYVPEQANYYPFLTPKEILTFYGRLFKINKDDLRQRVEELLELVGLSKAKDRRAGTFSKGMMQKISLAQALINDPKILILDEPTTGLDPLAKLKLREIFLGLQEKGKTLFLSSHELSEVALLSDSVAILYEGNVIGGGPLDQIVSDTDQNLERLFIRLIEDSRT